MRCIVPSCDHDSRQPSRSQNITFHLLPSEPSKRSAWLKALGTVNWKNTEQSVGVCSCHFLPEDMYFSHGRHKLRASAVPKGHRVFECLIKPCKVKVTRLQGISSLLYSMSSSECRDVKACRICLATDSKLYPTYMYRSLDHAYEALTGLSMANVEHLPPYLCTECVQRLLKCVDFRNRSLRTHMTLFEIAKKHDCITLNLIKSINRNRLKSLGVSHNQPDYYDTDVEFMEPECIHTDTQADNPDLNEIKIENDMFEYDHLSEDAINNTINIEVSSFLPEAAVVDEVKAEITDAPKWDCVGNDEGSCDDNFGGRSNFDDNRRRKGRENAKMMKTNVKKSFNTPKTKRGRKRKAPTDQALEGGNDTCIEDSCRITESRKRFKRKEKKEEEVKEKKDGEKENWEEKTDGGDGDLRLLEEKQKKLSRRLRDSLDRSVFTVTNLTLEEQVKEVQDRQHLPPYTSARYKCTVCYRGFNIKHCYEAHLVKHHELNGEYECVVCRVRTKDGNALRKHMTASHTRQYNCKLCQFVSRHKGAATQHQNFHAGIVYQCPHCPMFSNNYTTYQNHVRIKHASHYVCALCGYTFVNEKGLHMHKKIKHRIGDALVIDGPYCETCDVKFISEVAYERHLKLSSKHCSDNDPGRISNDPQKMWTDTERSRSLLLSRRTAIRKRSPSDYAASGPVVCEQCGEELMNLRAYAHHFRFMHPGKNRTQFSRHESYCMCELCGHVFRCNALLMGHMWLRHGVGDWRPRPPAAKRPRKTELPTYECPICGKLFTVKYNFQRHVFNHTGQRPHKCGECTKSFKSRAEKRSHVDHVHLKKPWPKRVRQRRKKGVSKAFASSDEEQGFKNYNKMVSISFDEEHYLKENYEGATACSDEEQDLRENNERVSTLFDNEQDFNEYNERLLILFDDEESLKEYNEGPSVFSDQEQDMKKNNEGVTVFSDEEQDLSEKNEGASEFSDEEQLLTENEVCIVETVWEDQ